MKRDVDDLFAWAMLLASLLLAPWIVPDGVLAHFDDPSYWGVRAFYAVLALLAVFRLMKGRGSRAERWTLAVLLLLMPLVYVGNVLRGAFGARWLAFELGGFALFAAIAWLGATRSPRALALGLIAHGVFWDAFHYPHPAHTPAWYSLGCMYVDVAVGFYAYVQMKHWSAQPGGVSTPGASG